MNKKRIFNPRPIVAAAICFCIGIISARYLSIWIVLPVLIAVAALSVLIIYKSKRTMAICMIMVSVCAAGYLRTLPSLAREVYPDADGKTSLLLCGTVRSMPSEYYERFSVELCDVAVRDGNGRYTDLSLDVQLICAEAFDVAVGDEITVTAKLSVPKKDGVRMSLLADGIGYRAYTYETPVIVKNSFSIKLLPAYAAQEICGAIDELYPVHAPTIRGMLMGMDESMDENMLETFRNIGISHILAVSGLHVGILAGFLSVVSGAFHLRRIKKFIFISLVLWLYCFVVGMPASAFRATIMATVYYFAKETGKKYDIYICIGAAALIILIINPLELFTLSFQLSFSAVCGIALIGDAIANRLPNKIPDFLRASVSVSLGAQIGVLPISVHTFGYVYCMSLIANIVIIPIVGIIVPTAFVSLMLFLVFPPAAKAVAYIAEGLTALAILIASTIEKILPVGINFAGISAVSVIMMYILIVMLSPLCMMKKRSKIILAAALSVCTAATMIIPL